MSYVVAIDGPAGSGKGTLAKGLSERLNLVNIDTGAMYRCVALKALRSNLGVNDKEEIIKIVNNINIELTEDGKVLMDNEDVTDEIRSKEVSEIVSPISNIPEVRECLVNIQRNIAKGKNVVMEGRDITTVVFPDAKYKIYLDADIDCRVKRRFLENKEKGIDMTLDEVKENIVSRDYNDMHKEIGALKKTDEQFYIDSTDLTIEEVLDTVIKYINE